MNGCDHQVADDDTARPERRAMGKDEERSQHRGRAGQEEDEEDAGSEDADKDRDRGAQSHPLAVQELVPSLRSRAGEGVAAQARQGAREKPELHVDMYLLGEEKDPHNTITVMVARERSTRMTIATVVPAKSARSFTSRRLMSFMKEVGILHQDVLVKSDQELAAKAILSDAGRVRSAEGGGRYMLEQILCEAPRATASWRWRFRASSSTCGS